MNRRPYRLRRLLAAVSICAFGIFAVSVTPARAIPAAITGYDIANAVTSGYFNWDHDYTGSIVTTGTVDGGFFGIGTTANYTGGGGELNDEVIASSSSDNQLFLTAANTSITLRLDAYYQIERIEFFGGNIPANSIPGRLDAVRVSIDGFNAELTETASASELVDPLTPFGTFLNSQGTPVDDFADLTAITGSDIDTIITNEIVLSEFSSSADGIYSISEIRVFGSFFAADIPEPPALFLLGLATLLIVRWRRI